MMLFPCPVVRRGAPALFVLFVLSAIAGCSAPGIRAESTQQESEAEASQAADTQPGLTVLRGDYLDRETVRDWIRRTSEERGLDQHRVAGLFARLKHRDDIIEKISAPAERTLTWREYRPIFLGNERIAAGRRYLVEHRAVFDRAEARFGVPAEVIAAIIGVETFYGRITGSDRVLEALATLGFDYPPRASFFLSELAEFLTLAEQEGWNPQEVLGSYAGAMGLPQFISSSYRRYAIDFDDDGRVDLFESVDDVIGSVAHYLEQHGWQRGAAVAERWTPASADRASAGALVRDGLKPAIATESVRRLGFSGEAGGEAASDAGVNPARQRLSVMTFAGDTGEELWVGYMNFYAITRYNHSRLYALAVHQLAEALGAGT